MSHEPSTEPAYKRLTGKDWLEVCNLAREGMVATKIAGIYGCHHSVIYRGLNKRGVKVGSALEEAKREEADKSRNDLIQRIKETKEGDYKFTDFLQKTVIKIVADAKSKDKTYASVLDDIKSIKLAMDTIRSGTNNKWRLLGLDQENENVDSVLPELPIREMTNDEVTQMRDRQDMEDGFDPDDIADDEIEADIDPDLVETS